MKQRLREIVKKLEADGWRVRRRGGRRRVQRPQPLELRAPCHRDDEGMAKKATGTRYPVSTGGNPEKSP
jgi:DNA-binding FadR family transcriptional regulator